MKSGAFPILPPKDWYNSLENQGVLFLNTSFTCEIGKPNSHKSIWHEFSKCVLHYISNKRPELKWFLWGREAQANIDYISRGEFLLCRHPSRVSESYEDDFLKFTGFTQTKRSINWLG